MFTRVVLATDFSASSEKSYAVGQALAAAFGTKLFVLHVVQPPRWSSYADPFGELELGEEVAARVTDALEAVQQRFRKAGIEIVARHRVGDARIEIVHFARLVNAHAILIASHGHGGLYERLLGGTTDRVVRRSGCPVLVASGHMPDDAAFGFRRVLFPTDLSAPSLPHVEALAAALAPRLAELHLLHVVQPQAFAPVFPGELAVTMSAASMEQERQLAEQRLADVARRLQESHPELHITSAMRVGASLTATIIAYRTEHDLELIAVPASRQSAEDPHYLGRTTESLLSKARVPVLVLK